MTPAVYSTRTLRVRLRELGLREDYLYPADYFVPVDVPIAARRVLSTNIRAYQCRSAGRPGGTGDLHSLLSRTAGDEERCWRPVGWWNWQSWKAAERGGGPRRAAGGPQVARRLRRCGGYSREGVDDTVQRGAWEE